MDVRIISEQQALNNQQQQANQEEIGEDLDVVPFPVKESNPLTPESEKYKHSKEFPLNVNNNNSQSSDPERSSSLINILAAYEKPPCKDKDAGNKPLDHYKSRLPSWRYDLRTALLPLIRWETPYLGYLQRSSRTVVLDLYFALTANLGTHTFYVIVLPIGYWFGISEFARSLVFVLALGVYVTGVIKDLLCLPRPLSPPLHRITMSGSAALEYGFPSTHSANAVSVGLLVWKALLDNKDSIGSLAYYLLIIANCIYVFSIVWGRVHCGMHGFCDIIIGSVIGSLLWWIRYAYGPLMDSFLLNPESIKPILFTVPTILLGVWIHPEPADDCPCFDDAVAFLGVLMGISIGQWHHSVLKGSPNIVYSFETSGLIGTILRAVIGITLIGIWRPTMKRALHGILPPIYRFIQSTGFNMPRRFFVPASQYEDVPAQHSDATFFEPYQITSMFTNLSKARRSDSVGPQSTADVYESLAYREYQRQRRDKKNSKSENKNKEAASSAIDIDDKKINTESYSNSSSSSSSDSADSSTSITPRTEDIVNSTIVAPRVRYDVEVVTKLIVYAGIAIIATDFCGVLFTSIGI